MSLLTLGCVREVEYSVANVEAASGRVLSNVGGELKVLKGEYAEKSYAKWRVKSEQVRVSLPQFSGANMFVTIMSGGDATPGRVVLGLRYERYHPIDSGGLTPVFDPRATIPCDGWTVETKRGKYPIDPSSCGQSMTFGGIDSEERVLKFNVQDKADEFTILSPKWQITWTLKQAGGMAYPRDELLELPPIAFYRSGQRASLDFAIR